MSDFLEKKLSWGLCEISGLSEEEQDRIFFPQTGNTAEARTYCDECELQQECLAYAIEKKIQTGIWGGKNTRERRRIARLKGAIPAEPVAEAHVIDTAESEVDFAEEVIAKGRCLNDVVDRREAITSFVHISGSNGIKAISLCMGCPIRSACDKDAVQRRVSYGVQGGVVRRLQPRPEDKYATNNYHLGKNVVELAIRRLENS